jgi:hypothetical protein
VDQSDGRPRVHTTREALRAVEPVEPVEMVEVEGVAMAREPVDRSANACGTRDL